MYFRWWGGVWLQQFWCYKHLISPIHTNVTLRSDLHTALTCASAPYAHYLAPIVLTRIFFYDQNRSEILVSRRRLADGLQLLVVHTKNTDVLAPAELQSPMGLIVEHTHSGHYAAEGCLD